MKGQISLEYLSTYSWAILILIAVMGSLTYYSFFGADFVQETYCNTGVFLSCQDMQLDTGLVRMKLKNNMEDTITNINIVANEKTLSSCELYKDGFLTSNIARGDSATLECSCITPTLNKGDSEELTFTVHFERNGGTTTHYVSGVIRANVREVNGC